MRHPIALATLVVALAFSGPLHAQAPSPGLHGLNAGGAAVWSSVDGPADESGVGTYFHVGADLFSVPAIARFGLEAGYLTTRKIATGGGSTRISNPALSAKATLVTLPMLDLHARIGYEDGDTSGLFQAIGGTFNLFPRVGVRAEYSNNNSFDAVSLGLQVRFH